MVAIRYARENKTPFFGICFGMQLAAIEFARHVCGISDATSREFEANKRGARNFVIDIMEEQRNEKNKGGTMRLGAYPCSLGNDTRVREIYGADHIQERHRHRYEFNNKYRPLFQKHGMTLSGICEERDLVEIIELSQHPWFVGVQFHPEFRSRPLAPHPLFRSFVEAALDNRLNNRKTSRAQEGRKVSKSVTSAKGAATVARASKTARRPRREPLM
jgi:CTP synthase